MQTIAKKRYSLRNRREFCEGTKVHAQAGYNRCVQFVFLFFLQISAKLFLTMVVIVETDITRMSFFVDINWSNESEDTRIALITVCVVYLHVHVYEPGV